MATAEGVPFEIAPPLDRRPYLMSTVRTAGRLAGKLSDLLSTSTHYIDRLDLRPPVEIEVPMAKPNSVFTKNVMPGQLVIKSLASELSSVRIKAMVPAEDVYPTGRWGAPSR